MKASTLIAVAVVVVVFASSFLYGGDISSNGSSVQTSAELSYDEMVVAFTLIAEAGGEGDEGIWAVACVIQQRSDERGLVPAEICLQPKQFSCWNNVGVVSWRNVVRRTPRHVLCAATDLAKDLVGNRDLGAQLIGCANHYHTLGVHPKWSKNMEPVAVIGHHKFYRF